MAQKIRVSIIVPVYNVAPYIADCLRSVMRQTYTGSMECLLVDDCGSDDSIAIAEQMIAAYEGPFQFQILHHERNSGLSAARNTGTKAARGEYLYYLDSDDEITEDCIERLMGKVAEYPDVEMVQGNVCMHRMDHKHHTFVKNNKAPLTVDNNDTRKCRYEYGQIYDCVWNKLLKRDFVVNNNIICQKGIIREDVLWVFYLIKYLKKACFVSEVTYHYKVRPHSIMTGTDHRTEGINLCTIYSIILNDLTPGHELDEFDYYGRRISREYIRFVRDVPDFNKVLQLCKDKCKFYGNRLLQLRLTVASVLGHLKFGQEIWTLLEWQKHPIIKIKAKLNALG